MTGLSAVDRSRLESTIAVRITWTGQDGEPVQCNGDLTECFSERLSVWVVEAGDREAYPRAGEAVFVHVPVDGGLYVVPCRLTADVNRYTFGWGMDLALGGEVVRLEPRRDRRVPMTSRNMPVRVLGEGGAVRRVALVNTLNLGGGGVLISSEEWFATGDQLELSLNLGDFGTVLVVAAVIDEARGLTDTAFEGRPHTCYRCVFTTITDTARQRILRYVFAQEMGERKRRRSLRVRTLISQVRVHQAVDGRVDRSFVVDVVDLGDGGLRVSSEVWLEPGTYLHVELSLPETPLIVAEVRVVDRVADPSDGEGRRYLYPCAFTAIADRDRQWILQRIFGGR